MRGADEVCGGGGVVTTVVGRVVVLDVVIGDAVAVVVVGGAGVGDVVDAAGSVLVAVARGLESTTLNTARPISGDLFTLAALTSISCRPTFSCETLNRVAEPSPAVPAKSKGARESIRRGAERIRGSSR